MRIVVALNCERFGKYRMFFVWIVIYFIDIISENKYGVLNLLVIELNENVGEFEMQYDKILKKKKRKKDKDGKENKLKCKEKGEKIKRKEKKNLKEKSDKDENLDFK